MRTKPTFSKTGGYHNRYDYSKSGDDIQLENGPIKGSSDDDDDDNEDGDGTHYYYC